jgi:hypothetical protein
MYRDCLIKCERLKSNLKLCEEAILVIQNEQEMKTNLIKESSLLKDLLKGLKTIGKLQSEIVFYKLFAFLDWTFFEISEIPLDAFFMEQTNEVSSA